MILRNLLKIFLLFATGYCTYIAIEVSFRGFSYILMGIVAGICFNLIDPLNNKISWDMPLLFQMLLSAAIITVLEILSGEYALHILGIRMWDYSLLWGNQFDGLFSPLFSGIWFLLSGLAILLCDAIDYYVLYGDIRPYYRLLNPNGRKYFLPERVCKKE